jgi:hypothetical protein
MVREIAVPLNTEARRLPSKGGEPPFPFLGCGQTFWNNFFKSYGEKVPFADWVEFAVENPFLYGIFFADKNSEKYDLVRQAEASAASSNTMALYDFLHPNLKAGKVWGGKDFEQVCKSEDEGKIRNFFEQKKGSYIVKEEVNEQDPYFLVICYDKDRSENSDFDVADFVHRARLYAKLWKEEFTAGILTSVATFFRCHKSNQVLVKMGFERAAGFYYGDYDYAGGYYEGDFRPDQPDFEKITTPQTAKGGGFSTACWAGSAPQLFDDFLSNCSPGEFQPPKEIEHFDENFKKYFGEKTLAQVYAAAEEHQAANDPSKLEPKPFSFNTSHGTGTATFFRNNYDGFYTGEGKYFCVSYSKDVITVYSTK